MLQAKLHPRIFLLLLFCLYMPHAALAAFSLPELLNLDDDYLSTGILDLTTGFNHLNGSVEPIADSDQYAEGIYVNGRLAFFLKGKIKGSALITAWLDSGADQSGQTVFDKLDPTRYYPIYGDDSETQNEAVSQGKFYLKLDGEDYQAIWGNYQAQLQGSELSSYNRSLYGFQLEGRRNNETVLKAFNSFPDSLHSRDTLLSTGGLLYYLRHGNIGVGSERVQVEIRELLAGKVLATHTLVPGDDFLIDYLQGRLILKVDIDSLAVSNRIIVDNLETEKQVYLIAEYDYEPGSTDVHGATIGYQVASEVVRGLKLSNTIYQESTGVDGRYNLFGLDLNYTGQKGFQLAASYAKSSNVLSGKYVSEDGGLTYSEDLSGESSGGQAYQVATKFNLRNLGVKLPDVQIAGNYSHWDAGFTNQRYTFHEDTDQYDLSLSGDLSRQVSYRNQYVHDQLGSKLINEIKVLHPYTKEITVKGELLHTAKSADETHQVKGALKAEYQLAPRAKIYGSQQLTLYSSEQIRDDRTTLGTEFWLADALSINLEGSAGNAGDLVSLGGQYGYGKGQVYSAVSLSEQKVGRVVETTFGGRAQVSDNTTAFSERKVTTSNNEESTSNVVGLDYALNNRWGLSFDYTSSDVVTAEGLNVSREIVTPGIAFTSCDLEGRLKLQYRKDQGGTELDQYVITSGFKYHLNKELSVSLNLDHSTTQEVAGAVAEYSKAGVGFAYRPVRHDRLNLLGMYTYLLDTAPQDQESVADNEERAQVMSVEAIYELNQYWQLAEKIAYKNATVRVDDELHDSDTYLWITRGNYHLNQDWDLFGEYRTLRNPQARDDKSGFLVGFTRGLDENTQIGLGFNFTDFNDDLTELNYDAHGLFINFLRKW